MLHGVVLHKGVPFSFPTPRTSDLMRRLVSIFVFTIAGCSAQTIRTIGDGLSPYAPANERSQAGVVKYPGDGAGIVIKCRRGSA